MDLTKLQLSELMCKHAAKGNGLHDLMEIMIESMMVAERGEFLADNPGNKGNGYRPGSTYGQGRKLEFRIPRDRYGNFHPQILAILRDQEEECDRLAGVLYTKGLTQEQVSDVFDQIYGRHYSKSSISRMVECVRTQVNEWLERGLEEYYPVVFVDCVHIKIHRKRSVASEAFYVALAVTEEGTREVLGIFNMPQESATGWGDIFDKLKERGVQRVGLMVADGIKGLDTVIGEKFPGTPLRYPSETQHVRQGKAWGQGCLGRRPARCVPHRPTGLHSRNGMGEVAGNVRQMGQGLSRYKAAPKQRRLQGVHDIPQLCT